MSLQNDRCIVWIPDQAARDAAEGLPGANWYLAFKRVADLICALMFLVVTAPLIVLMGLLVKATSRGPIIYSQTRLGRGGRPYTIYKIRSMADNCESRTGPRWAAARDPRVTAIGRFLRRTHLDELPQLWNVVRGEMSLVGPRPERPEFVSQLERVIPCYRDRMVVLPGLTGLAQVQLPPDSDIAGVHRKLACDLYYVRRVDAWLDLKILLSTVTHVVGIPFAVPRTLLGVPSGEVVESAYEALATRGGAVAQMQPA